MNEQNAKYDHQLVARDRKERETRTPNARLYFDPGLFLFSSSMKSSIVY